MKSCENCQSMNPDAARYCMACGQRLPDMAAREKAQFRFAGLNVLALSVLGSIALSLLLMVVFNLPVFFLAAFLPLLWTFRKK